MSLCNDGLATKCQEKLNCKIRAMVPIIICLKFHISVSDLKGFLCSKACLLSLQLYQIVLFQQSLILLIFPDHYNYNSLTILSLIFSEPSRLYDKFMQMLSKNIQQIQSNITANDSVYEQYHSTSINFFFALSSGMSIAGVKTLEH